MIIAIEGLDASGKATQSKLLAERMRGVVVSFPAYDTPVGCAIEGHLKERWRISTAVSGNINALVLQCLMTVNRLEILPAINRLVANEIPVVLDRYWLSALVYGAVDGLDEDWLRTIHAVLPVPDVWVFLDVPPEEAKARRPKSRDRYEADGRMQERRRCYLKHFAAARSDKRWQIVDGVGTIKHVAERIRDALGAAWILT